MVLIAPRPTFLPLPPGTGKKSPLYIYPCPSIGFCHLYLPSQETIREPAPTHETLWSLKPDSNPGGSEEQGQPRVPTKQEAMLFCPKSCHPCYLKAVPVKDMVGEECSPKDNGVYEKGEEHGGDLGQAGENCE